jgi:hypothetical protein
VAVAGAVAVAAAVTSGVAVGEGVAVSTGVSVGTTGATLRAHTPSSVAAYSVDLELGVTASDVTPDPLGVPSCSQVLPPSVLR